ncbi:MAG: cell shape determination protein CcmA [Beggiatoa sp. IS2]|nr:MAG: cell shape determination protein CcmA [Beggiatoa sp. IS2]
MWGNRKKKITIDSTIAQGTEIKGNIVFSGGLYIEGLLEGNVTAKKDSESVLVLDKQGTIKGEVRVPNIILNGTVTGDVHALEHIELAPQARIRGDVYYNLIEMAVGAEVNGSLVHTANGSQSPLSLEHKDTKKGKSLLGKEDKK